MTDENVIKFFREQANYVKNNHSMYPPQDIYDSLFRMTDELKQYRSIGTVEECRAAVEKQREKKPLSRTHCKDGNHPLSQDIGRCPSCNGIVAEDMLWCDDCGQKLDWGDSP